MKPALRKLRRLAIWLLSLLLLLAAAEYASVLWLDHRSTHYVVPGETNGSPAWVDNPLFPLRFALPRAAGLPPPMAAVRDSEDRAYRVAVLTDSTPLGPAEHSADYAYPRQLEALLRARLPDIPVEVLHLTLPGANSHVLREIARDLPLLKPDAVVVVCGNDELTGPCGPCAPPAVAPAPWPLHPGPSFARPFVLFSRLRLAQAISGLLARAFPDRADRAVWQTREPQLLGPWLRPDAPALADARDAYSDNLDAILSLASASSPTVIACTTPVNLRDCPPFATAWSRDADTSQLDREALFRAAANETHYPDESARLYETILHRSPTHAEALYRSGHLALLRGHPDEAARRLTAARDADACRVRCDSVFNLLLAEAADRADVPLLDAASIFAENAPDHLPGRDLFLDAIHPTFEGHYLLATSILGALDAAGALPAPSDPDAPPPALPTSDALADALLHTPWGRAADLAATLAGMREPPYRDRPGQPPVTAAVAEDKARADAQVAALASVAPAIHARRLAAAPGDPALAAAAARYFLSVRDCPSAVPAAATAARAWPHRPDIISLPILADLLARDPDTEADAAVRRAIPAEALRAESARMGILYATDVELKRMAKEVKADANGYEENLKDRLNDILPDWAVSLSDEEAARPDAPWPADTLALVRTAAAAAAAAAESHAAASNALAAATAEAAAIQAELDEANRKAESATADLKAAQADLDKARTATTADPLAAAQALADRIRRTDQLQSAELAARTSAQMIAQRLVRAQDELSARRADLDAAQADLDAAVHDRSAAVRDLRRAYLKAREDYLENLPDTGDDRVDWLDFPEIWGVPYPETLALTARASKRAADRAVKASEEAHRAVTDLDDFITNRMREYRKTASKALLENHLPALLSATVAPSASSATRPDPAQLAAALGIGQRLAARGLYPLAIPWFRYILGIDPADPDAAFALSRSLSGLYYGEEALAVLREASARLPSDPVLLDELGFHLRLARDEDAARDVYDRSDALAPFRYSRYFGRAYALQAIRSFVVAFRTLRRYLEYYPDDPDALALRDKIARYLPADFDPDAKTAPSAKPSLLDSLKE